MKLYEPRTAVSFFKVGPKNEYKFEMGNPIGGHCLEDELWMNRLAAAGILKCVVDTNSAPAKTISSAVKPKTIILDKADILPHTKPDIVRDKGRKSEAEKAAEIAVAKSEAKMKVIGDAQEKQKFDNQKIQNFFDFIKCVMENPKKD